MKCHYVYKLTDPETGEFYYGSRSCTGPIECDSYMGSYKRWVPDDTTRLVKTVVEVNFETREDAIEFESTLIEEHIDNKLNRNYHIPNKGFYNKGYPNNPFKTITRLRQFCETYDYEFDPKHIDEIDVYEIKHQWLEKQKDNKCDITIRQDHTTQKYICRNKGIEIID